MTSPSNNSPKPRLITHVEATRIHSPKNIVPIVPPENPAFFEILADAPLQRLNAIRKTEIVVRAKVPSVSSSPLHFQVKEERLPTLTFSIDNFSQFVLNKCRKQIEGPAWIIGGSANHILFEEIIPADVDLCFYLASPYLLDKALDLVIDFAIEKLIELKIDTSKISNLRKRVHDEYIHEKTIDKEKKKFTFICFGGAFDLQFIADKEHRRAVALCEAFHIALIDKPTAMCLRGRRWQCNAYEYNKAKEQLHNYIYEIDFAYEVKNLIFRLPLKITQGFSINSRVLEISVDNFSLEYALNTEYKIRERFSKYMEKHYSSENLHGRMFYFLNFLSVLANKKQTENFPLLAIQIYCKIIANSWLSNTPLHLFNFSTLITKYPAATRDLLNLVLGLFFINWIRNQKDISAFPKAKTGNNLLLQFCLTNSNGKQRLGINHHPVEMVFQFIRSLRILTQEFSKNKEDYNNFFSIGSELGLSSIKLNFENRTELLKEIVLAFNSEPFYNILNDLNLSFEKIYEALGKEIAESGEVLLSEYCIVQSQLEKFLKDAKLINNTKAIVLISYLRAHLSKSVSLQKDLESILGHTTELIKTKTFFLSKSFIAVLHRTFNYILVKIDAKTSVSDLITLQKFMKELSALDIYQKMEKQDFEINHFKACATVFSADQPEQLFTVYKYLKELLKQKSLSQSIIESLQIMENKLALQMLDVTIKFITSQQCDSAFHTFTISLKTELHKKSPEKIPEIFYSLIEYALLKKTGKLIYLAGLASKELLPMLKLDLKNHENVQKVAESLLNEECENVVSLSTRKKLSNEILAALSNQTYGNSTQILICQKLKNIFLSGWEDSKTEITEIIEIFKKTDHLSEKIQKALLNLELAVNNESQVSKEILHFILNMSPEIVESILNDKKFSEQITELDKEILLWSLISKRISMPNLDANQAFYAWKTASCLITKQTKNLWFIQTICSLKMFNLMISENSKASSEDTDLIISFILKILVVNGDKIVALSGDNQIQLNKLLCELLPQLISKCNENHFDLFGSFFSKGFQTSMIDAKFAILLYFDFITKLHLCNQKPDEEHVNWLLIDNAYKDDIKLAIVNGFSKFFKLALENEKSKFRTNEVIFYFLKFLQSDLIPKFWDVASEMIFVSLFTLTPQNALIKLILEKNLFVKFSTASKISTAKILINQQNVTLLKKIWPELELQNALSKEELYELCEALKNSRNSDFIGLIRTIFVETDSNDGYFYKSYLEGLISIGQVLDLKDILQDFKSFEILNLASIREKFNERTVFLQRSFSNENVIDQDHQDLCTNALEQLGKVNAIKVKEAYECHVALFEYVDTVMLKSQNKDDVFIFAEIISLYYSDFNKNSADIEKSDKLKIITSCISILCKTKKKAPISVAVALYTAEIKENIPLLIQILESLSIIPSDSWEVSYYELIPHLAPNLDSCNDLTYQKIFELIKLYQNTSDQRWKTGFDIFCKLIINIHDAKSTDKDYYKPILKEKIFFQEIYKNLINFSKLALKYNRFKTLTLLDKTATYFLKDAHVKTYYKSHIAHIESYTFPENFDLKGCQKIANHLLYFCMICGNKTPMQCRNIAEQFIGKIVDVCDKSSDLDKVYCLIRLGFSFIDNRIIQQLFTGAHTPVVKNHYNDQEPDEDKKLRTMSIWLEFFLINQININYTSSILPYMLERYKSILDKLAFSRFGFDCNIVLHIFSEIHDLFIYEYLTGKKEKYKQFIELFKKTLVILKSNDAIFDLTSKVMNKLIIFPALFQAIVTEAQDQGDTNSPDNIYDDLQSFINQETATLPLACHPQFQFLNEKERFDYICSACTFEKVGCCLI